MATVSIRSRQSRWSSALVGLGQGSRLYFWGRDPDLQAFFRDHADDVFVAHYAVAEMKYLPCLGISLARPLV